MKKHTKAALIVASCLSIGATFLMIHPSQAFFLDLPQQKNGIRQDTDKQMNQPGKDVQDIRIIKEETPDKQDKADEKKNQKKNRCQKKTLRRKLRKITKRTCRILSQKYHRWKATSLRPYRNEEKP